MSENKKTTETPETQLYILHYLNRGLRTQAFFKGDFSIDEAKIKARAYCANRNIRFLDVTPFLIDINTIQDSLEMVG